MATPPGQWQETNCPSGGDVEGLEFRLDGAARIGPINVQWLGDCLVVPVDWEPCAGACAGAGDIPCARRLASPKTPAVRRGEDFAGGFVQATGELL